MEKEEIIEGLKSLIDDRESFITENKEDCEIFIQDKDVLVAAIDYINNNNSDEYKGYFESMRKRFKHLMQSKFISKYDEYDFKKGNYKYDIEEVDKIMKNEINITEQKPMILVDAEKYENLIASKYYTMGKLSEIEKQLLLQEQIGFLKAENRILRNRKEQKWRI